MKVKDIMTKDVMTVSSDYGIDQVANLLIENRIHGLPVVDDGKLVGIITETDFFVKDSFNFHLPSYIDFIRKTKFSGKMSSTEKKQIAELINSTARDIMTEQCVTVQVEDEIEKLLGVFKNTRFSTVPVVDENGELRGIVTRSDVIRTIRL